MSSDTRYENECKAFETRRSNLLIALVLCRREYVYLVLFFQPYILHGCNLRQRGLNERVSK